MMTFFDHPMIRLFFDLSANGGWNLCAMMTYSGFIMLVIFALIENRKGN